VCHAPDLIEALRINRVLGQILSEAEKGFVLVTKFGSGLMTVFVKQQRGRHGDAPAEWITSMPTTGSETN
jgi:hypothetical protein